MPILLATALALQIHPLRFSGGAVVSDSKIASDVGAKILRDGGNAVDAAVGVGFALAVTFPQAGNLGGGGFMLVRMADGKMVAIDYRETAPRRASKDMYLANPRESLTGYRASGVPGTPMGMWEAHRRFGKLPWKRVVQPAHDLAKNGFAVPYDLATDLKNARALFQRFPASWRQFVREGKPYEPGELLRQADLAKTLALIRDRGPKGFYEGETASLIELAMRENGGLVDARDLSGYGAKLREPLVGSYRECTVITMPPPSSGGIALLQMLVMIEGDNLANLGWHSSSWLHLIVETMKRAFADRATHLADPDFVPVPINRLLDRDHISSMRNSISDRATPSEQIKGLASTMGSGMHTTHYSIVDKDGNAVANTYTLNTGFGSGVVIPGTGVLMNNEMDDFATQPGKPNVFGLIQSDKNSIAPGKRPLSSMTPTILLREGKLFMVLGSPGGPTIINTVFQTILNVVDHKMSIQQAVAAPRFHHQWLPDSISWERFGLQGDLRKAMEAKGHRFASAGSLMGSCQAIAVDPLTHERLVGVDPRVSSSGAAGQ
jgi:gamma-glutamyltranspeptidase/glutathione hydrolase